MLQISYGDEMAFTQIYNKYQPLLSTHIFRLTRSRALTDEITQDIFLKIWTNKESLTKVNNFKAYLSVMSKNHALNVLRQLSKEKARYLKWQSEAFSISQTEDALAGATGELETLLDSAIDQLPPQQKKAYILSRHQRMKYAEIAEKLQLTRGTVKRYLQIAAESITKQIHRQAIKDVVKMISFLIISRL